MEDLVIEHLIRQKDLFESFKVHIAKYIYIFHMNHVFAGID